MRTIIEQRRPTDPVYPKEIRIPLYLDKLVITYECDCGRRVNEKLKKCRHCGRINTDWFFNHVKHVEKELIYSDEIDV